MEEFRRPLVEEGTAETPEAVGSHPINLDRQGSVANSLLGDRAPLSDEDDKDGRDVRANRADGEAGAPLLRPNGGESDPQPAPLATLLRSPSFWGATTNLSKVILGASMMTLPRTFNLLGLVAGVCLLVGVGVLTHVTLVGIVAAADIAGTHSYGGTVLRVLGPRAVRLFNVALLLSVLGLEVVVLVVAGDLLVGRPPEYGGLLEEMLPALDPQAWYLDRRTVLAAVTCLLLAPLVSMRNMARLAPVNAVGVASIGLLAACCAGLAAAAAAQGASHPLRLLPDWRGLGDTGVAKAMQLAGLLPML